MHLTANDLGFVPSENLDVPLSTFVDVWDAVENVVAASDPLSWYLAGAVVTCRWLAQATIRPETGDWYPADSPITRRALLAGPELIEAERVAAHQLAAADPRPLWLAARPGWVEGVIATFEWAWSGTGAPPINIADVDLTGT